MHVSPVVLGFPHHFLVDPTGAGLGVRAKGAFFLDYGKWDATILPQISMVLRNDIIRVDALVALNVSRGGPWLVVEFDGAAHASSREWDKIRDSRLLPKVLRFPTSCILAPGFPETLKAAFAQELGRRALRAS